MKNPSNILHQNHLRWTHFIVFVALLASALTIGSCARKDSHELSPGDYRAEFFLRNHRIPFNFSVVADTAGHLQVYLKNAEERAKLDSVYYKGDSVVISIDFYDAQLIGKINGDSVHGYFKKNQLAGRGIPFVASAGQNTRFSITDTSDIAQAGGKWNAKLISIKDQKSDTNSVVAVFEQKGARVTGTILTTTGDYRYLQGSVDHHTLRLSGFGGSNPILLEAYLENDQLKGELIASRSTTTIIATKDETASLPDPYSLTQLRKGNERLNFTFPDLNGKPVSLKDEKYKNKVVVVTIMGSWCPNCIDEAQFLAPWYKQNKHRGIEIVGLTFERQDDLNFAREKVNKLIKRFDIQYDILFAGLADMHVAATKLPELSAFLSFPTTFLIDRQGKVRKIHTGYTGPATGKYYEAFLVEFNKDIDELL